MWSRSEPAFRAPPADVFFDGFKESGSSLACNRRARRPGGHRRRPVFIVLQVHRTVQFSKSRPVSAIFCRARFTAALLHALPIRTACSPPHPAHRAFTLPHLPASSSRPADFFRRSCRPDAFTLAVQWSRALHSTAPSGFFQAVRSCFSFEPPLFGPACCQPFRSTRAYLSAPSALRKPASMRLAASPCPGENSVRRPFSGRGDGPRRAPLQGCRARAKRAARPRPPGRWAVGIGRYRGLTCLTCLADASPLLRFLAGLGVW